MKKLVFQAAGLTDVGSKEVNEDAFMYRVVDAGTHYAGVFAVADGVGGLARGELASALAISNVNRWWYENFRQYYGNREMLADSLMETFRRTNDELLDWQYRKNMRSCTTLTVLFLHQNEAVVFHIGDSRLYLASGWPVKRLHCMTKDHSRLVEKQNDGRTVTKNVLTECLGNKQEFHCEVQTKPVKRGDLFMLCSDGVYKTIPDEQILQIVENRKVDLSGACGHLIEKAKLNGEKDNISAILVRITDSNTI